MKLALLTIVYIASAQGHAHNEKHVPADPPWCDEDLKSSLIDTDRSNLNPIEQKWIDIGSLQLQKKVSPEVLKIVSAVNQMRKKPGTWTEVARVEYQTLLRIIDNYLVDKQIKKHSDITLSLRLELLKKYKSQIIVNLGQAHFDRRAYIDLSRKIATLTTDCNPCESGRQKVLYPGYLGEPISHAVQRFEKYFAEEDRYWTPNESNAFAWPTFTKLTDTDLLFLNIFAITPMGLITENEIKVHGESYGREEMFTHDEFHALRMSKEYAKAIKKWLPYFFKNGVHIVPILAAFYAIHESEILKHLDDFANCPPSNRFMNTKTRGGLMDYIYSNLNFIKNRMNTPDDLSNAPREFQQETGRDPSLLIQEIRAVVIEALDSFPAAYPP